MNMKTSMRGPYTGPRGGVYYIDANGNKQYGEPPMKSREAKAAWPPEAYLKELKRRPKSIGTGEIVIRHTKTKALKAWGYKRPWKNDLTAKSRAAEIIAEANRAPAHMRQEYGRSLVAAEMRRILGIR
jgi:hypothetical protein